MNDVARPFITGMFLAGAIAYFFPEAWILGANDHPFISMCIMLAAGIPMYVCATSSTPIAAALILKGLNPGAAIVFLLAGPATNAATMNVVKSLFGRRALMIYLGTIAACSLLIGAITDQIYHSLGMAPGAGIGEGAHLLPDIVLLAGAGILGVLILRQLIRQGVSSGKKT